MKKTDEGEILIAAKRPEDKKIKKELLMNASVFGVLYGPKTKNVNLVFDKKQAKFIESKANEAVVLSLKIDGEDKARNVIIKETQSDKLTNKIVHVDLYEVDMTQEIETKVPVEFIGSAPAVKAFGAIIVKNIDELEVRCLPANLPETIEVDLTPLSNIEDMISVSDIKLPNGVEVLNNPEDVVVMAQAPRSEAEMEELNEEVKDDVSKVEGVADKEVKEEEEGEDKGKKE